MFRLSPCSTTSLLVISRHLQVVFTVSFVYFSVSFIRCCIFCRLPTFLSVSACFCILFSPLVIFHVLVHGFDLPPIGPLHDPVTWYKITHAGEQVAQLDFQNKATEVQVVRVALLWKWTSKVRITGWGSFKLLETIRCVLRNIERFQMNLGSLVKDLVRSSNILFFLQVELTDTTIIFRRQRKQTAVTNITTHGLKKITVLLFVMFVTAVLEIEIMAEEQECHVRILLFTSWLPLCWFVCFNSRTIFLGKQWWSCEKFNQESRTWLDEKFYRLPKLEVGGRSPIWQRNFGN